MIQIQNLTYRYPRNPGGIQPTSGNFSPGEIIHIKGSSGCGKSTLARCITGIIPHLYRGDMEDRVTIFNQDTATTPLWRLFESMGFVFQNPSLQILSHSVQEEIIMGLENLGLDRDEITKRTLESFNQFNLGAMKDRDPRTLSGGEQQKLTLASVTARMPKALVLDEPLSMLDITAATELIQYIDSVE